MLGDFPVFALESYLLSYASIVLVCRWKWWSGSRSVGRHRRKLPKFCYYGSLPKSHTLLLFLYCELDWLY